MADDALLDFERSEFTYAGTTRTVFRRGSGPAVIVIAEIPGITPKVLDFARKVADLGCTAVLPHLFGIPGLDPNASNLAALKGRTDAIAHRREVAEQMSDVEIAAAQREARAWMTTH